jgi:hypothetical protein
MQTVKKALTGIGIILLFCLIVILSSIPFPAPRDKVSMREVTVMTDEMRTQCADEMIKFCENRPVNGKMPGCLWDNRAFLSVECGETLRKVQRRRD